jgi:hypothetical protein
MSVMCYDGCMILRTGETWHIAGMGLCSAFSEDGFLSIVLEAFLVLVCRARYRCGWEIVWSSGWW